MNSSIKPGQVWLDTNGNRIQAHGFSVFYSEKDQTYYWYGENKEHTKGKTTVWHWGVRCYSSKDLYIACADRWKPGKVNEIKSRLFYKFVKASANSPGYRSRVRIDRSPKLPQPLPKAERVNKDNTWKSDYVWLPIEWIDGRPTLRWREEWRVEDF